MTVIASFAPSFSMRRMSPRLEMRASLAQQSSFLGQRMLPQKVFLPGLARTQHSGLQPGRAPMIVEANGKRCLGDTTFGTRRSRTRTSGFRSRRLTVGGRKVLRARRSKGRKLLCPANSNRGTKSTAASNRR